MYVVQIGALRTGFLFHDRDTAVAYAEANHDGKGYQVVPKVMSTCTRLVWGPEQENK